MLERDIADPRIGFATVTQVETSPDLRHARVWVSVIGGAAERHETIAALERAMVYIRRELGTRLRLKRIPDLSVRLDDSIERGTRVLQLIDSLEGGEPPEPPPSGESLPTPGHASTEGFGQAAAEHAAAVDASRRARHRAKRQKTQREHR